MADPIGNLLRELIGAAIGYRAGKAREKDREIVLLEREKLRYERRQMQRIIAELRSDAVDRVANRVYARLYAKLASAAVDASHPMFMGQKFPLRDLIGTSILAQFSLEIAEFIRKELRQQP